MSAPDRSERVRDLFDEVVDLEPRERAARLADACGGDEELRHEVESLLGAADATGWGARRALEEVRGEGGEGDRQVSAPGVIPAALQAHLADRYTIEGEIGRGGMATVYLAEDLRHRRKVALKVLKPELAAVVGAERFLAEIETTANLQHPHILPLHDSGEADSFLFYVMPYVDGETLRQRLERETQLPVDEAVRIASDLAEALDYAHRHGVVHRDIKPANVLMVDGKPVISDFGIALAVGSLDGRRLTETGLTPGTPHYMSPEQAAGDGQVGPAADIYSLGCVLFEVLVGEPPFTGSTPQAILGKIIAGEAPSAASERSSVPGHVDAVVAKALEKLPADRFRTAREMATALADPTFRHGRPGGETTRRGSGAPGARAAVLALWAVVATVAAIWAIMRPEPPRPVERWTISDPMFGRLSAVPVAGPDQSLLVPNYNTGQLWYKEGPTFAPRLIEGVEGTGRYSVAAFAPAGDEFVVVSDGQLKVVELAGGGVTVLADSAFCCPRWERDGFVYFTGRDRGIERVPAGGGPPEVITELDSSEVDPHSDFALLPDGRAGVFYRWGPTLEARIEAVELETGRRTPLIAGRRPYLTPDGRLVYWFEGGLRVVPIDGKALAVTAAPTTVEEGVGTTEPGGYPMFSLSAAGTLVYRAGGNDVGGEARLFWVSRSGASTPVDLGWSFQDPGYGNFGWSLSPGEDRIATWTREGGNLDIWIKELPDGPFHPLTLDPARDMDPAWSQDGRDVLFVSDRGGGNLDLWAKRADGSDEARLVYDAEDNIAYGFWSPNGVWLVMRTQAADGDKNIIAVRPEVHGDVLQVAATTAEELGPALSPDGRWLAYESNVSGQSEVYVVGFPDLTGPWRISDGGGTRPVWARAGGELFYVSLERRFVLARLRTEGVPTVIDREPLFTVPRDYQVQSNADFYSVSRDGQRFLMGTTDRYIMNRLGQLRLVKNWWEAAARTKPN